MAPLGLLPSSVEEERRPAHLEFQLHQQNSIQNQDPWYKLNLPQEVNTTIFLFYFQSMFKMWPFLTSSMLPCWCEPPSSCHWIPAVAFQLVSLILLLPPHSIICTTKWSDTFKMKVRSYHFSAQNFLKTLHFTWTKAKVFTMTFKASCSPIIHLTLTLTTPHLTHQPQCSSLLQETKHALFWSLCKDCSPHCECPSPERPSWLIL